MSSLNVHETNSYFYFDFPEEILEQEGNDKCADCDAPSPTWASKNLGVLICLKCSGVHRNLGSHISKLQSIFLDTKWTEESIKIFEQRGNAKVNEILEFHLNQNEDGNPTYFKKPDENATVEERQAFIENKYVHQKFKERKLDEENVITYIERQYSDSDEEETKTENKFLGIGSTPERKKKPSIIGKIGKISENFKKPDTKQKKKIRHDRQMSYDIGAIPTTTIETVNKDQGMVEYKGILKIKLFGAARLISKESHCNAFFIFKIGSQNVQSKIVKKSNSPYYEKEELMICMNSKDDPLYISCFDKVTFKDRLVGTAVTLVDDCFENPGSIKDYSLNLIDQKKITGTVEFSTSFELFKH
eukprot:gene3878-7092_t